MYTTVRGINESNCCQTSFKRMGKNKSKKKSGKQQEPTTTDRSMERRTEEDIRNDDKELAHFRDVGRTLIMREIMCRYNTPFWTMRNTCFTNGTAVRDPMNLFPINTRST